MQEHRQLIKRASMERETAGLANANFENRLELLCNSLMKPFMKVHFVYCNGP
jgi:hypothetical protein